MRNKLLVLTVAVFNCLLCYAYNQRGGTETRIVIDIQLPKSFNKDSVRLESSVLNYLTAAPSWEARTEKVVNNRILWILYSDQPLLLKSLALGDVVRILHPGDSVTVTLNEKGKLQFLHGAKALQLQVEVEQLFFTVKKPLRNITHIKSLDDYLQYKKYLDELLELAIAKIESAKNDIPASVYEYIKVTTVSWIESERTQSFYAFSMLLEKNEGWTMSDITAVYDSTMNGKWTTWFYSRSTSIGTDVQFCYYHARVRAWMKFGFDLLHDSLNTAQKRKVQYYNVINTEFKGQLREKTLQYFLAEEVFKEHGYYDPVTRYLLNRYYASPGFPEYKQSMKAFEREKAKSNTAIPIYKNGFAPGFELTDMKGAAFSKKNLEGKIALLYVWYSGCEDCTEIVPQLRRVKETFKNDPNVVFVDISTDKNQAEWLKSVDQQKYTAGGQSINLYTGGQGITHPMLRDYDITTYPAIFLLNQHGELVQYPLPDSRKDGGSGLIHIIKRTMSELHDGPYVLYNSDSILVNYIDYNFKKAIRTVRTEIRKRVEKKSVVVNVLTDQFPTTFSVQLKPALKPEPCVFSEPSRQLVLSDIEGNFDAFRKLLLTNGVIDEKYNWTFGKGHVVLVGDIFDRGMQVTECLWLIYSLEEKAKQAGGYVHLILGNHEIMNLSGDLDYVTDKYKTNTALLNIQYNDLYGKNSELGGWLRTKNIMEKIGDILYTHAGISREINNLSLSIAQINELVRPHYADAGNYRSMPQQDLQTLFNSRFSPFWYRGYYSSRSFDHTSIIDSTLLKFNVQRIITGHTVVADTISVHYGGKVINTDVLHAQGKSEALLIEGNEYYRVTGDGKKRLLLTSARRPRT